LSIFLSMPCSTPFGIEDSDSSNGLRLKR